MARVEAVLRRVGDTRPSPANLTVGEVTLDLSRCKVSCKQQLIAKLTPLECRLLEILMINRDQVMLADTLIDQVWGPNGGDKDMLKQLVYRLRHKIEICPSKLMFIETVSGVGYSLNFASEKK